jgi:hypothetical protein
MFFRKSKIAKDDDASFQESGEYTYLFVPNIVCNVLINFQFSNFI